MILKALDRYRGILRVKIHDAAELLYSRDGAIWNSVYYLRHFPPLEPLVVGCSFTNKGIEREKFLTNMSKEWRYVGIRLASKIIEL